MTAGRRPSTGNHPWGFVLTKPLANINRQQAFFLLCLCALLLANAVFLALQSEALLPKFLTVRSAGFAFPSLHDSGLALRNIVLILMVVVGMVAAVATRSKSSAEERLAASRLAMPADRGSIALAVLVFCWGLYVSYPPQISYTNFRILWVDMTGNDAKIRYLGQIARTFFYEYPHLLQAVAFLVSFLSLQAISRRAGSSPLVAGTIALAVCVSSAFVEFSGVGEDWLLVGAASLAVFWAYGSRNWGLLMLSIVVLGGLRMPSALLLLVAISLVEIARAVAAVRRRPAKWASLAGLTFLRIALLVLSVVFSSYLAHLHFMRFGEGLATIDAMDLQQISIDGFMLTRFSGAYIGHALWSFPAVIGASCVTVLVFVHRHVRTAIGRVALVSALSMGGGLLMYEAFISNQYYYNYRYMIMGLPLGIPAFLYLLGKFRLGWVFTAPALLSLLLAHPTNAFQSLKGDISAKQQMEHELYSCRRVLSPWLQQRMVFVESSRKDLINSVHYVRGLDGASTDLRRVRDIKGKRNFGPADAVLVTARRGRELRKRGGFREVESCRGWVVLLAAPRRTVKSKR